MSDTILRRKNTGEPGNGGLFGTATHDSDTITLGTVTSTPGPSQQHITLAAEHASMNPGSNGADPKHWWRLDRAKALLSSDEPIEHTDAEHTGWVSVDRNITPMVQDWLQSGQPLTWVAFQVRNQEVASRGQVEKSAGLTDQTAWTARADRLADITRGFDALVAEERAEKDAAMLDGTVAAVTAALAEKVMPDVAEVQAKIRADMAAKPVTVKPPVFAEVNRRRRGQKFFVADMQKWPQLHTHDDTPLDEVPIVGHFFAASFDFWAAEYDPQTGQAWGYTRINGLGPGEWGYQDMQEVEQLRVGPLKQPIERETYWSKTAWKDVDGK